MVQGPILHLHISTSQDLLQVEVINKAFDADLHVLDQGHAQRQNEEDAVQVSVFRRLYPTRILLRNRG